MERKDIEKLIDEWNNAEPGDRIPLKFSKVQSIISFLSDITSVRLKCRN